MGRRVKTLVIFFNKDSNLPLLFVPPLRVEETKPMHTDVLLEIHRKGRMKGTDTD